MATIDLDDINFALRELVRLQLAGEIAADAAWRERQQLLDAVEAYWDEVPEQAATISAAPDTVADEPSRPVPRWRRLLNSAYQTLWPRVRELGLAWALVGLTIATCLYVASL